MGAAGQAAGRFGATAASIALLAAGTLRRRVGLPASASLVAAGAREAGIDTVASAEADLERVEGLRLYRPTDL